MRRSSRQSAAKANDALLSGDKKDVSSTDVARDEPKDSGPAVEPKTAAASSSTTAKGRKRKAADASPAASSPAKETTPAVKPQAKKAKGKQAAASPEVEMAGAAPAAASSAGAPAGPSASPPPVAPSLVKGSDEIAKPAADVKGKGKARAAVAYKDESDEYKSEDEKPAKKKKKTAKAKAPKISNWKELLTPSQVDLGMFPNEILSQIVSVDADLDLRDHLALAATCRFFRSCYNDLVWQILFQAHFPHIDGELAEIHVDYTAERQRDAYSYATVKADPTTVKSYVSGPSFGDPYRWNPKFGPFARGWMPARHLFSSGTAGAPGAARWGLSKAEWDAGEPARKELAEATRAAVASNTKTPSRYSYEEGLIEVAVGVYDPPVYRELTDIEKTYYPQHETHVANRLQREAEANALAAYDPWPSVWRRLIATIVNKPLLTKTDAKKYFKVQDRELLAIPLVEKIRDGPGRYESYGIPTHGGYRLAQLQCLSLRAHGGVKGHEEYVKKLQATAKKAEATRIRNGTNKRKKAPYPAMSLAMLQDFMAEMMEADYDDGYYDGGSDSMDGYDSMDGLDDLDGYPYPYFGY